MAVVLSGGGAKGAAHIGALKVIERAGLPVDYVVGTSMGAIVGGLYAVGYTPEELDSMMCSQNWRLLLSDRPAPQDQLLDERLQAERYVLSVPFTLRGGDVSDAGIIKGRNLARLFSELTWQYPDSLCFDSLPIPFACVSEDLVNGTEVVFHQGVLATAMRASMSIPGVFSPVDLNGMVLVDGGLVNNYPVNVARAMGADLVIGVDVQTPLYDAAELKSVKNIMGQIVNLQGERQYKENLKQTNVHIKVNVEGYSAASFTTEAIDTLISRGEQAALQQWDSLLALRASLHLPSGYRPHRPVSSRLLTASQADTVPVDAQIAVPPVREDKLNLAFRFDTEELAAIEANTDIYVGSQQRGRLNLTLRLGRRTFGQLGYTLGSSRRWQAALSYRFAYNDISVYNAGERTLDLTYTHNLIRFSVARTRNRSQLSAGVDFEDYHYHDLLSQTEVAPYLFRNETLLSYYLIYIYNSSSP